MTHVLKVTEWPSGSGEAWYVADISKPAAFSSDWGWIAKLLNLSLCDYVSLLYNKYKANRITYHSTCNMLLFSFATQNDARKFKNDINKIAREKNFLIY